jgi:HlyD family secretion protein
MTERATRPRKKSRVGGVLAYVAGLLLAAAFVGTLIFLYTKSKDDGPAYETDKPLVANIVKKAVATGRIVPRHEIQIKPRASGIIRAIHVEPGAIVKEGDLIAEIKIVPDMAALTRAEAAVRSARIALKHKKLELKRSERLSERGLVSNRELSEVKLDYQLQRAQLASAVEELQVVREGAARQGGDASNTMVRSTVAGTVLEVQVEEGGTVIESNNFNEGTPIASVADMSDMIFLGRVDEADVDKVRLGMDVVIKIGAIDDQKFEGKLEYIAPKGSELEGAIQFEIKAALSPAKDQVIRAGYSANAEIVLERRDDVLAIKESLLQFEGDDAYVDIEVGPNEFERRDLDLGISDGINVEIKSGVEADTPIKKPTPTDDKPKS